jgi:hypothetical protein
VKTLSSPVRIFPHSEEFPSESRNGKRARASNNRSETLPADIPGEQFMHPVSITLLASKNYGAKIHKDVDPAKKNNSKIQRFKNSRIRFMRMKGISTRGRPFHLFPGPSLAERGANAGRTKNKAGTVSGFESN